MSEQLDVAGAIDRHFEAMDPGVRARVMGLADMVGSLSTAAMRGTEPCAIVHMPAALLDEDKLPQAVNTLLEPDERAPHWTTVNGNTTPGGMKDLRVVRHFRPVFEDIQEDAGGLLLGAMLTTYPPGTPIGTVRADTVDAGIETYRRFCKEHDLPPKDIMLINADADTRAITRLQGGPYAAQVAHMRRHASAAYLEVFPQVMHAEIDDERFPRIHRLIAWRDYMNMLFGFSYAAQYATNLYGYLDSGGFDRTWDNNEQLKMGEAMAARAAKTGEQFESIPLRHVFASVSPRRYAIELMTGQHIGYGALTVPADGRLVHEQPRKVRDLSDKAMRREVSYEVKRICMRGLDKFVAMHVREYGGSDRAAALDYAFEKVCELIRQERQDTPNTGNMNSIALAALAKFGERVEKMKADKKISSIR